MCVSEDVTIGCICRIAVLTQLAPCAGQQLLVSRGERRECLVSLQEGSSLRSCEVSETITTIEGMHQLTYCITLSHSLQAHLVTGHVQNSHTPFAKHGQHVVVSV